MILPAPDDTNFVCAAPGNVVHLTFVVLMQQSAHVNVYVTDMPHEVQANVHALSIPAEAKGSGVELKLTVTAPDTKRKGEEEYDGVSFVSSVCVRQHMMIAIMMLMIVPNRRRRVLGGGLISIFEFRR